MEVKPGYKQTEVGVIPEEWDVLPCRELCDKIQDGTHFSPKIRGNDYLYITSKNIGFGFIDFSDAERIDSAQHRAIYKRCDVRNGDLLLTKDGANTGNAALNPLKEEFSLLSSVAFLRFDSASHSAGYFLQQILSGPGQRRIKDAMSGNAITRLTLEKIRKLTFPIPPLFEQRAIAEALSDVDELLRGLDRFIVKKRDLRQAAMQQLLTGRTRLPGFHGEWAVKSLGDLFDFTGGYSASRDQLSSEGYCYLHYGDIHGATKTTVDVRIDYQDIPKLNVSLKRVASKSLLEDGDVVFVDASEDDDGTSRHVVVVNEDNKPFISGLHTIVAKSKTNELVHEYRRYCFQTAAVRQQFLFYAVGTKVTGISKTNMAKLTLLVPNLQEQTAIASVLMDMDGELSVLEKWREKTFFLQHAMMQEVLTGRIRLVPPSQAVTEKSGHNWQINEAVIIGALALQFGTEGWPLPRKRRVKLTYLLHRHAEGRAEGYLKKAAGPYNPKTKYQGPEGIALKNGYVRERNNGRYEGLIAGKKIAQAEQYFTEWYPGGKEWLEQFRFKKTDYLEVLATVDMAMADLKSSNSAVSLDAVKEVIRAHPEWEAKLSRAVFSDAKIAETMSKCEQLFMSSTGI